MNEEIKYLYIYNIEQCSFYMQHNVYSVDCGVHPRTKMIWHKFVKEDTKDVYLLWLEQCKEKKNEKVIIKEG